MGFFTGFGSLYSLETKKSVGVARNSRRYHEPGEHHGRKTGRASVNLAMAVIWLFFALVLVLGNWLNWDLGSMNSMKGNAIVPMLALIMSLYNFSRWWYMQIQTRYEKNPPHVKPRVAKSAEYHPEFDFSKDPPNDPPPNPSTNGHS